MGKIICNIQECTACGACENICSQNCINKHFLPNDSWFMEINESKCIHCGMCDKVCPNITKPILNRSSAVFVSWARNDIDATLSASGGIATEIYKYAIEKDAFFVGVYLDAKFEAHYKISNDKNDIEYFKNSKYTFSYMDNVYEKIISRIKEGFEVFFIGLPCQVAALKNYAKLKNCENGLITIDLVCHGTPAPVYLQQHILHIFETIKSDFSKLFFRDPAYGTDAFVFSLYSDKKQTNMNCSPIYKKYVYEDDLYQIGYHGSFIYRDCCYRCHYAQRDRIGDLTICDYPGLGVLENYTDRKKNVSCVFINTNQGNRLFNALCKNGFITSVPRSFIEPYSFQLQINKPNTKTKIAEYFFSEYEKYHDFDKAAEIAFKKIKNKNKLLEFLHIRTIKSVARTILPRNYLLRIKRIILNRKQ